MNFFAREKLVAKIYRNENQFLKDIWKKYEKGYPSNLVSVSMGGNTWTIGVLLSTGYVVYGDIKESKVVQWCNEEAKEP